MTDAYALVAGTPVRDECTQDWTLVSAEVDDAGGIVFEVERALDTGDPQDRALVDDSVEGPLRIVPLILFLVWLLSVFSQGHINVKLDCEASPSGGESGGQEVMCDTPRMP